MHLTCLWQICQIENKEQKLMMHLVHWKTEYDAPQGSIFDVLLTFFTSLSI